MKSHFTVEQFFHPKLRAQLGVVLALLRVAFAYALVNSGLCLHEAMPEALARLKVQVVPFLEAFATAWSFPVWSWVLVAAGLAVGVGFFTRTAAAVLLVFLAGVAVIDHTALAACLGPWTGVALLLLTAALLSQWGRVFGVDELVERLGLFEKKRKRSGISF